jgi:hypothetical protein
MPASYSPGPRPNGCLFVYICPLIVQMYEIHSAVAAIRVDGKAFTDICTKIPIGDIFHTRRRRRDAAVAALLPPSKINSDGMTNGTDAKNNSGPTLDVDEALSDDEAQPAAAAATAVEDDHYDTLWADYDYSADIKAQVDTERQKIRIDFDKYGPKKPGQKRVDDTQVELPDDIYCDLVNSLNDVCLQSSLLEIWKYDRLGV